MRNFPSESRAKLSPVSFDEIYLKPGLFSRVLCLSNVQKPLYVYTIFLQDIFIDLGVSFYRQIYHVTYSTSNIRLLCLGKSSFFCVFKLLPPFIQVLIIFSSLPLFVSSPTLLINISLPQSYEEPFSFIFPFPLFLRLSHSPWRFFFDEREDGREAKIHFLFIKSTEKSLLSLNAEIFLIPRTRLSHSLSRVSRSAPSYITINENFSLKDFRLP